MLRVVKVTRDIRDSKDLKGFESIFSSAVWLGDKKSYRGLLDSFFIIGIAGTMSLLLWLLLFFEEAGFEYDAATVNFAVYFFRIFSEANAFHFCATFDYH